MTDADRLGFIERWTTLHYGVEIIYIVDGYSLEILHDENLAFGPFYGEAFKAAIDAAILGMQARGDPPPKPKP
jgi:hypothetical protein